MGLSTAHAYRINGVLCIKESGVRYFIKFPREEKTEQPRRTEELNFIQKTMFFRLLKGLSNYTAEEIAGLDERSLAKISGQHKVAKAIIVRLMKTAFIKPYNDLIFSIFPQYKEELEYKFRLPNSLTLRELNISYTDICKEFVKEKLLPEDFFELTPESVNQNLPK